MLLVFGKMLCLEIEFFIPQESVVVILENLIFLYFKFQ